MFRKSLLYEDENYCQVKIFFPVYLQAPSSIPEMICNGLNYIHARKVALNSFLSYFQGIFSFAHCLAKVTVALLIFQSSFSKHFKFMGPSRSACSSVNSRLLKPCVCVCVCVCMYVLFFLFFFFLCQKSASFIINSI